MSPEARTPASSGTTPGAMDEESYAALQSAARDHLWMHFTRMSSYDHADVPVRSCEGSTSKPSSVAVL